MKTPISMPNIPDKRRVSLTRAYRFSAAHRLTSPFLDAEENRRVYGKCGNPAGHGHNYLLRVTVKGPVDPVTGSVFPVSKLDEIVGQNVIEPFDHRNLNQVLGNIPIVTSEVLAEEIWRRLTPHLTGVEFERIEIDETRKNSFSYPVIEPK